MRKTYRSMVIVALLLFSAAGFAQNYPHKPVRIVVPFAAGGSSDTVARIIAQELTKVLGQSVLVENRPGASTQIGTNLVAKSAPDGYTLLMAAPVIVINPHLFKNIPYDTFRDFEPIIYITTAPSYLIVNAAALPTEDVKGLIAYIKARPGKISYSSSGNTGVTHLLGEWFKSMTKVDAMHVPYKGDAPAVADLAAGQVQYGFGFLTTAMPYITGGRVRLIAEASATRSHATPNVPTFAELGYPGFEGAVESFLLAPAGTPKDIVARLNAEINNILKLTDLRQRYANLGMVTVGGTPAQAMVHMRSEDAKWSKIIKESSITAE